MNSVKCGIRTTLYGNFRKCGTRFYPVRSGAVRYKVLVMASFFYRIENQKEQSDITDHRQNKATVRTKKKTDHIQDQTDYSWHKPYNGFRYTHRHLTFYFDRKLGILRLRLRVIQELRSINKSIHDILQLKSNFFFFFLGGGGGGVNFGKYSKYEIKINIAK